MHYLIWSNPKNPNSHKVQPDTHFLLFYGSLHPLNSTSYLRPLKLPSLKFTKKIIISKTYLYYYQAAARY